MNKLYMEYVRKKKGKTTRDMAALIGKSPVSYGKKERGEIKFSDDEKVIVARELELTQEQFNYLFFDGNLPSW